MGNKSQCHHETFYLSSLQVIPYLRARNDLKMENYFFPIHFFPIIALPMVELLDIKQAELDSVFAMKPAKRRKLQACFNMLARCDG